MISTAKRNTRPQSAIASNLYNFWTYIEAARYFTAMNAGAASFRLGNVIYVWHDDSWFSLNRNPNNKAH